MQETCRKDENPPPSTSQGVTMNVNYDLLFQEAKSKAKEGSKLLLHVCCAPCATYCLTRLMDVFDITLYFSDDNIFPDAEWEKRLGEVKKLVDIVNNGQFEQKAKFPLKLHVKQYNYGNFLHCAKGLEKEREGGARCEKCFELRLDDTRNFADANGFDYFATTLTVSPYKNSQVINVVGGGLAKKAQWLCTDFKKHNGYNESVRLSQKYGLYRQHYCGCAFALLQMQREQKQND